MRPPALSLKQIGRAGAVLLVAAAILGLAIAISLSDRSVGPPAERIPSVNAVNAGLERCRTLGTAAENDAECLATWAQLRRRFFDTKPPAGGRP